MFARVKFEQTVTKVGMNTQGALEAIEEEREECPSLDKQNQVLGKLQRISVQEESCPSHSVQAPKGTGGLKDAR